MDRPSSLPEAMERISAAAQRAKPGPWLIVAGGWTERQFKEERRPTQAELLAAAPDNPVYVQLFYSAALLTPGGYKALGITTDADLPPRGKIERDADGKPTGWILGDNPHHQRPVRPAAAADLRARTSTARGSSSASSTASGITGVIDPGGYNLPRRATSRCSSSGATAALTVRVAYSLFAPAPRQRARGLPELTQMLPMGFGDDWLRFNGIGENVTWGMYNNDNADRRAEGAALSGLQMGGVARA